MSLTVSADIGGTNTRFILASASTNQVIFSQKYRNEDFPTFLEVLKRFLWEDAKLKVPPITACFAVAGPVKENKVVFTNRSSWSIDGDEIGKQLNIQKVRLINDFLAVGYGLLTLDEKTECICLQEGERKSSSPIACIGAGTGLGECFLTPVDGTYHCFPSEGGHAEFAPRNDVSDYLF
jgi:glucokinase